MSSYREINGKRLPRVTSILSVIAKPQLYAWYAAKGSEANTILRSSAQRGSDVHRAIEALQSGHKWDDVVKTLGKEPNKYLLGYKKFREEWNYKPIKKFNQKLVWSEKHEYCGEVDEYGTLTNYRSGSNYDNVLIDYKTSSGIYPEYGLQVAAYRMALIEMGNDCHTAGILRVTNTGNYELKMYGADQLDEYFTVFMYAKKVYEWKERQT